MESLCNGILSYPYPMHPSSPACLQDAQLSQDRVSLPSQCLQHHTWSLCLWIHFHIRLLHSSKKKKRLKIQFCIPVLNKIPVTQSFPTHLGPWDSEVREVSHQGLRLFRSLSHYFCGLHPSPRLTNINLILSFVADKFTLLKNCHELIDETIPDLG